MMRARDKKKNKKERTINISSDSAQRLVLSVGEGILTRIQCVAQAQLVKYIVVYADLAVVIGPAWRTH